MDIDIKTARQSVKDGDSYLWRAEREQSTAQATMFAAIAQAHFAASVAITNLLLTDPAEMPEPLEL